MSLTWNLKEVTERAHALDFIKKFEDSLCVFSPITQQLYVNFEILPVDQTLERLVVLPDHKIYHQIHSNLMVNAIKNTPFYIVPASTEDGAELCLAQKRKDGRWKCWRYKEHMEKLLDNNPNFIPVINFNNIKEIGKKLPIFQISYIDMNELINLSKFSKTNIVKDVNLKFESHLRKAA